MLGLLYVIKNTLISEGKIPITKVGRRSWDLHNIEFLKKRLRILLKISSIYKLQTLDVDLFMEMFFDMTKLINFVK